MVLALTFTRNTSMRNASWIAAVVCLLTPGCSDPERMRLRETTRPTYDKDTGKLKALTYDFNKNGTIDTWTEMDGTRPVLSRMDRDEDGKVDHWEYYDDKGLVEKVGMSRRDNGLPDVWAFAGKDGKSVARIDVSSTSNMEKIDRWEHYYAAALIAAEEDTNGDGRIDKWETFVGGAVKTAAFDDNGNGRPVRRLTYDGAKLVAIESEPDAAGRFAKRVEVR